ncbi:MAG: YdcF family protein [Acidimicrobiales bacterium]
MAAAYAARLETGHPIGYTGRVSRPRIGRILRIASAALIVGSVAYALAVFVSVARAAESAQDRAAPPGTIVVLGAAQYDGVPSPVFERRLETAVGLWEADTAGSIVTTGANQPGDTFTEGFAGFAWLREAGVPEERIVVVIDGGDTYESLLAAANQLGPDAEILLVTDAYHAKRSEETAAEVGLDATVVAAGDDMSMGRLFRESVAVGLGRIVSYRRLSAWR